MQPEGTVKMSQHGASFPLYVILTASLRLCCSQPDDSSVEQHIFLRVL